MKDHIAVYMLDVGQGDSTLIVLPDNRVVVFDCADDHVLRRMFEDWGLEEIHAFVLSHLDWDHIAGALSFLQGFGGKVRHVYVGQDRDIAETHEDAKRAKALVDYAKEQSRDDGARERRWELIPNFRSPHPIAQGEGWAIRILAPPYAADLTQAREGSWEDPNRYSSILRIEAGERALLVGGDAPLLSWSELPAEERPARVVRVSHHGGAIDDGGVPSGWDVTRLYREIGAATAVVSVGTTNSHGHPHPAWISPLTGGRCRLLCTQVTARCHGRLRIEDGDGGIRWDLDAVARARERVLTQHHQWAAPQYRHLADRRRGSSPALEVPCAGTILVKLYLDGRLEERPAPGGRHEEVVDGWEHPLCRMAPSDA